MCSFLSDVSRRFVGLDSRAASIEQRSIPLDQKSDPPMSAMTRVGRMRAHRGVYEADHDIAGTNIACVMIACQGGEFSSNAKASDIAAPTGTRATV